ncbi:TfoX/Sxy family protein [Blastococcus sp. PRF04-17]|uniref:TfoX/Sxy family protein n=1 Tax=Blastococcus sp. PRF04-17 TaxID=2933797 RepID=UPI001FF5E060|nr:TfoX/Sxy family protein [Blastococcus sp. PRF04-17]UOY01109.1 TfoX/Sxy family protein [Blastococcus sp. PRF04-17]
MADDDSWPDLVERMRGGDVTPGKMFGSEGLRTGRKFFALWWRDHLVVKLPPARLQELVTAGQAEVFEPMEGRPMNGWALLRESVAWDPVVAEARDHVAAQVG